MTGSSVACDALENLISVPPHEEHHVLRFRSVIKKNIEPVLTVQVKKRKSSATQSEVAVAIGWYSLRDWQLLKRVAADAGSLHATYGEWVDEVERTIATLRDAGTHIEKLNVDVEELQQWCQIRSLENTAANRARFIVEKHRERGERF